MAHDPAHATLVKLSDTEWTVAEQTADIRGRRVLDPEGEEVGAVEDLLIDDRERKVRLLQVASGGFLGLGATTFLLPVEAITRISDETVHIDQRRAHIAGAPRYDPALVDQRYVHDLYGHYGYAPYWSAAGVYPPYPLEPPRSERPPQ
jgi:sporulation protein YlmC with PRC-barrel domain